jgi:uncharacterized protein (TIGR03382 family)
MSLTATAAPPRDHRPPDPAARRDLQQRLPGAASRWAAALALCLCSTASPAGERLLHGEFSTDDALFVTHLSLLTDDVLTVQSLSYGGDPGLKVDPGGFAPVLALFQDDPGAPQLLLQLVHGDGSHCGTGKPDPASGFCWDAAFSLALGPGHYTLVLSQDGNDPLGQSLAEGYSQSGQADYTGLAALGEPGRRFVQIDGAQRTGAWALDLQASAVPEPVGAALMLIGLAGLALQARRRTAAPQ